MKGYQIMNLQHSVANRPIEDPTAEKKQKENVTKEQVI